MTAPNRCLRGLIAGLFSVACAQSPGAQPALCASGSTADRGKAEQKIVLHERLVIDSDPARRVEASGNALARQSLADARAGIDQARAALDSGCAIDAAGIADEGLARASTAFRQVRNADTRLESEYRRLRDRARQSLQTISALPAESRGIDAVDMAGMTRQIDRADELAINGDYAQAARLMTPVADRLERRVVAIFDQRTLVYDRSFGGPEDEYRYLEEQYRGYRLLFDRALPERPLSRSAAAAFERLSAEASALADEASTLASNGDWEAALGAIEAAIEHSERALRTPGLGY